MRLSSVSRDSKRSCSPAWFVSVLLSLAAIHTRAGDALPIPQQVSLSPDMAAQQLSISWLGGAATSFDLMILRTEFNESVFYEAVSATVDLGSGRHRWNWTSAEPLECTSLSIRIRSRDGQTTSDWSETEILQGKDFPSNDIFEMYPQDRVVPVGANTTFCCIVKEGMTFGSIQTGYGAASIARRLSRRSYATTVVNQGPSSFSGTNIICYNSEKELRGTVVFVGYPPLPTDFVCETRDLTSAYCHWKEGQNTHLRGKRRGTFYSVNKSPPQQARTHTMDTWAGNWTLVAVNPLGQYSLADQADISHRVYPVAPANLSGAIQAWSATVRWDWQYSSYSSLALVCQVDIHNSGDITTRTFSGVGLRSAVLSDLHPYEAYSVRVRCGAQQDFWKWGDWSKLLDFKTSSTIPDAPDVWVWMSSDDVCQVMWKPPTRRQSHGPLTGYEVTFWSPEENLQHRETFTPDTSATTLNLTQLVTSGADRVVATVVATNKVGASQQARVLIPLHGTDVEPSVSRAVYSDGGFPLSWDSDANATCGYVVQWSEASCTQPCAPDWTKVATGSTNVSVESANFQPGVRYNFSLYSCSAEPPQLLRCWQGYMQELVPSSSVSLSAHQRESDILLIWDEIPMASRRGFILGYNIYNNVDSNLTLLASLSDPESRRFLVKEFSVGTYKFTVKAFTSAGEDRGATASVMLRIRDWLILEILASLGATALFLVIITFVCYKKRKWVKKAFYPDIPEPKLPGDWSRTQGPMDVKPPSHSMVHIVEKPEWDSSKEMLVVIPEEDEDEEGMGDEPVDTDEPTSLRYYNHVVDERPSRPHFPDSSASSASSLDSARTDVTYTGIQTSGSSLVWPVDPQGSFDGHRPAQADVTVCSGDTGGGYRPQMQPRAPSTDSGPASPEPLLEPQAPDSAGGYKPQGSWHFDSAAAENDGLAPSLGSPTSVGSTQFLLPDGEEHGEEKRQLSSSAASWFSNLLSSSKP